MSGFSRTHVARRQPAPRLRPFLETPHVHRWDSMMVVEETTKSLFPADLFLQPGDQPPVVTENLADGMCNVYRKVGMFAHESPVRQAVSRIAALDLDWIHPLHGGMVLGRRLEFDANLAVR